MRRFLSIVGLLSWLFTACGTVPVAENQTPLSDTKMNGIGVCPTPGSTIVATPTAEDLSAVIQPTLSPVQTPIAPPPPTLPPNPTPAPQFALFKNLPITSGRGPHYLAGWSPDGSLIAYTAIGAQPGMADVYTLNVQSGAHQLIAADAFLGLRSSGGVLALDMGAPRWKAQQNELILSKLKPNNKQAIVITDANGTIKKTIATEELGAYAFHDDETLVIASAKKIKQNKGSRVTIDVPELVGDALLSFKENGHGKFAFLPQANKLHIAALNDASYHWITTTADLKKQSKLSPDVDGSRLKFKDVVWSPDGTKMAFWLGTETDHELWIADENGKIFVSMLVIPQSRGGHIAWSPDGTMLAFTVTPTGAGANEYISLNIAYVADGHSEVVDTGVQLNPIWDASGTQVAIQKNGISIYRIK